MGVTSVLTLVVAMVATSAASRFTGLPVSQVDFAVEGGTLPESARSLVGIHTGDPYDPAAIRRSIKQLFALGAFSDIKVEAEDGVHGVELTFRLYPAVRFEDVSVPGLDNGSKELKRLRDSVLEDSGIRPGNLFDANRVEGTAVRIEDELARSGFRWGEVEPEVQFAGPAASVRFHVKPGPRARLHEFRVHGVAQHVEDDIRRRISARPGTHYSGKALTKDVDRLVSGWKAKGFYQAGAEIRETFEPPDSVHVDLAIELGPRVLVEVGGAELSERMKNRLIPVLREQSISEDLLEESRANLEEFFRDKGYRDAVVTLVRSTHSQGRYLLLRFETDLGTKLHVGDVRIEGLSSVESGQVARCTRKPIHRTSWIWSFVSRRDPGLSWRPSRLTARISCLQRMCSRHPFSKWAPPFMPRELSKPERASSISIRTRVSKK
jgi:outer membrane protein assembly factor BamA